MSKRDIESNLPVINHQVNKKDSTKVDINPGSNCQVYKKDSTIKVDNQPKVAEIVIKKTLNPIKGEAGGLSDQTSNPSRGQAVNICKLILSDIVKSIILDKKESAKARLC